MRASDDASDSDASDGRDGGVVDLLCPVALDHPLSYRAPPGLGLRPGDLVEAPLGARATLGVVWAVGSQPPRAGLKSVTRIVERDATPATLRRFVDWVADWTLAPKGLVLRMALRDPERIGPEPIRLGVRATGRQPARLTPARARALAAAEGGLIHARGALARIADVGAGVIDALLDEGALEGAALPAEFIAAPDPRHAPPDLNTDQRAAADYLRARVRDGRFSTTLLEGVTGSGKTEVFFEAVAQALDQGRQALILMPEIGLTGQVLERFERRFGARPAEWHSGIAGRRRERAFVAVRSGEAKVVIGARSALFLPFRHLGLIVVDEEHDAGYKQEDGVAYHARDMAVVRGHIEGAAVVLASATPSIESRVNALAGRYAHLSLPSRHQARALPEVALIDLRREPPARGRWLSPRLETAVRETLGRGEQALLYINRRGYAPLTLCRSCGHRFRCPDCAAWLVEHRATRSLRCHHCGHREPRPDSCPACGAVDDLIPCGPGVERLAEEAATAFPQARLLVLSSDLPGGVERLRRELGDVAERRYDLIIGTQLVAKGHHFPGLSLIGVIDGDMGAASGDPRAAERAFQTLRQVSGRAGRGETPGRALIQTHDPASAPLRALASGDAEAFYAQEIAIRREAGLPPFGRVASLLVAAPDREAARQHARALASAAPPSTEVTVLGPAEAALAMLRGRHRWRILVLAPRAFPLQAWLRDWLSRAPKAQGGTRVTIDVDPVSLL